MDDLLNPTTFWLTVGFALMALELVSGAAVLIFCGFGALAVGTLLAAGVTLSVAWQVVLAAALAVASLVVLRPLVRGWLRPRGGYSDHVGGVVVAETAVGHQTAGRVRHRGTVWQARTVRGESLDAGEQGIVTGVEGIELRVRRG